MFNKQEMKARILAKWGYTCWLCETPIIFMKSPGLLSSMDRISYEEYNYHYRRYSFSIDHVIPKCKGGVDSLWNLHPAHPHCNNERPKYFPRTLNPIFLLAFVRAAALSSTPEAEVRLLSHLGALRQAPLERLDTSLERLFLLDNTGHLCRFVRRLSEAK